MALLSFSTNGSTGAGVGAQYVGRVTSAKCTGAKKQHGPLPRIGKMRQPQHSHAGIDTHREWELGLGTWTPLPRVKEREGEERERGRRILTGMSTAQLSRNSR